MTEASREAREMQFRKIKADPSSHYANPQDVVSDDRFETGQKVEILAQWGKDLLKLDPDAAHAEDPMSDQAVKDVARAIESLGADPEKMLDIRS